MENRSFASSKNEDSYLSPRFRSASRIDNGEYRYFFVSIRLYPFIYFYLDDLHLSEDTRKRVREISEIYIYVFSQSPRSKRELGFWTNILASSPFVRQTNIEI